MLGGFIKYLEQCDWKDRGYHEAAAEREQPKAKRPPSKRRKPRRWSVPMTSKPGGPAKGLAPVSHQHRPAVITAHGFAIPGFRDSTI